MESLAWVLLGFMTASWLGLLVAGSYAFWRYAYKPWQITRSDLRALQAVCEGLRTEIGQRQAQSLSPEQVALLERQKRMKTLAHALDGGGPANLG